MDAPMSSKKMVELVRRLALGTEQEVITWKATDSDNRESYNTTVSETNIIIEGSRQDDHISIAVFDSVGRVLASVDTDRLTDSGEKKALENLFRTVRFKSGGIDGHIDGILDQLPQDSLRSF